MEVTPSAIGPAHRIFALVGGALQLVAGFYVAASILLAPLWGVAVLFAVWLATTYWAVRNWRKHQFATLFAFAIMVAFWVGFLLLGDALFDDFGA